MILIEFYMNFRIANIYRSTEKKKHLVILNPFRIYKSQATTYSAKSHPFIPTINNFPCALI